jgi:hypothetical protein
VRGITARYDAAELGSTPLAAQLMGSNAELLAAAAVHLVQHKQAPRIDLNCGAWHHAHAGTTLATHVQPCSHWRLGVTCACPAETQHGGLHTPPDMLRSQAARPTW